MTWGQGGEQHLLLSLHHNLVTSPGLIAQVTERPMQGTMRPGQSRVPLLAILLKPCEHQKSLPQCLSQCHEGGQRKGD